MTIPKNKTMKTTTNPNKPTPEFGIWDLSFGI